jgi:hypothetical protein
LRLTLEKGGAIFFMKWLPFFSAFSTSRLPASDCVANLPIPVCEVLRRENA